MQHFVPYTPQQNGVVEHKNRAFQEMATCMLEDKDLSPNIWDKAINCVEYFQNIFPHKLLEQKTPFEAWSGHKPNVSHFRVFGSKAWARIPPEKRKESIMVGYAEYENGYKIFDPSYYKSFIERSVQFKEDPMQEIELVKGGLVTPSTQ